MRKLILKLLLFTPIPITVGVVNYWQDPSHLFDSEKYVNKLAISLLKGKSSVIQDHDERLLQKSFISHIEVPFDVIVLGSSRALEISHDLFPDKEFFNHSVSGGVLQDYMAIVNLYRKKNILPTTIIFGMDPWLVNANNGEIRWQSVGEDYLEMLATLKADSGLDVLKTKELLLSKMYELFSYRYFSNSIRQILVKGSSQGNSEDHGRLTKSPDGSIIYGTSMLNSTSEQSDQAARNYIRSNPIYHLKEFDEIDTNLYRLLVEFTEYLISNDVEIIFFLSPYHPMVYNFLINSQQYKVIHEVEELYRNLAATHGITIIGSYDPNHFSLPVNGFYDGMHPRRDVIENLIFEISHE